MGGEEREGHKFHRLIIGVHFGSTFNRPITRDKGRLTQWPGKRISSLEFRAMPQFSPGTIINRSSGTDIHGCGVSRESKPQARDGSH